MRIEKDKVIFFFEFITKTFDPLCVRVEFSSKSANTRLKRLRRTASQYFAELISLTNAAWQGGFRLCAVAWLPAHVFGPCQHWQKAYPPLHLQKKHHLDQMVLWVCQQQNT